MRASLALSLLLLAGCQAFNDDCTALVADPDAVVVKLGEDVYLDRPNARHDNNALGQGSADAYADVMTAELAVLNSGSLRSEGLCGVTRNVVRGELTDQVFHEILLFENTIVAIDLNGSELKSMFEHSAEQLFPAGQPIVSPSGQFLQVSKQVTLSLDCSKPIGSRVTALSVNGVAVVTNDAQRLFRVALSSFLLNGGDGFLLPTRNVSQAQKLGGIDSNIASDYLKRTYRGSTLQKQGRITFSNCAVPVKPPG
ncbi:MAG: 5'-nucleotidase C-terminal domain-containing protein [Archangiaceae bacterium]|nr:5'-nucleotidase C-terminal domain-containing protein [Archangiaceae bacterium]